jgi:DNA-binding LytR/AlgR family response regulator
MHTILIEVEAGYPVKEWTPPFLLRIIKKAYAVLKRTEWGEFVKVVIEQVDRSADEQVTIRCYTVTDRVNSIVHFIRSSGTTLTGYHDEQITQVPLQDIFYVEAVDNRVFAYTREQVFELKFKLYEFEDIYRCHRFIRCSKSMVINLMQIDSVYPIFNGRFSAKMFNGEEIIISRQYVPA